MKQESFLRDKYEAEGLYVNQIATLTFSSRSTVVKYLEGFNIPIRMDDRTNHVRFGRRWRNGRIVLNKREQATIEKAKRLGSEGLSYEKIAAVMNAMNVNTKSGLTTFEVVSPMEP